MSVTTALGALAFGVYIFSGISRRPKTALAVRPVLTQTEKERVELLYRQVRPRFNDPTSERIIELNRSEVNLLLKAFQAVHPEKALVHAEITFWNDWFHVRYSEPVGTMGLNDWWWNWSFEFRLSTAAREIRLEGRNFRVNGRLVPEVWGRRRLFPRIEQALRKSSLFAAVEWLTPERGSRIRIQFRYTPDVQKLFKQILGDLSFTVGVPKNEITDCLDVLLKASPLTAEQRVRWFFRNLPRILPREQSVRRRNRAALITLAIASGDLDIEHRLGIVLPEDRRTTIQTRPLTVPLAGKEGLWGPFLTGAADTIIDSPKLALQNGIEREQRASLTKDGWSYPRLLATLAGIAFAQAATATESEAQDFLRQVREHGFGGNIFFPADIRDIPEHLSASQIEGIYGGLNGLKHLRLMADLRVLVRKCSAYRGVNLP
jgi:hypothetical protein